MVHIGADIRDNAVFAQMAQIAECLCAKNIENGLPKFCFCGIIAGEQPYDASGVAGDCEDSNGQAWVRFANGYSSNTVGVADLTPGNCASGFGYDLEIGTLRWIGHDQQGESTPEDMLEATALQIADCLMIQQALLCCDGLDSENFVLGPYLPLGPEGFLVGGTWTISVLVV